jgi:hypothetical protein
VYKVFPSSESEHLHPGREAKSSSTAQVHNNDDTDDDVVEEVPNPNPTTTPSITAKRPPGRKGEKDKQKNGGDAVVFKTTVEEIIGSKSKLEEVKKLKKDLRWSEVKAMEERKAAIKEEKLRVLADEVQPIEMEQEYKIMFTNPAGLDTAQLQYFEFMKAQNLASKMVGGASAHGSVDGHNTGMWQW